MADVVMGFSSAHAPMMSADPGSAPPDQAERFFAALDHVRAELARTRAQALVMLSGEHFTNFFLDNLPQVAVGLGHDHLGPVEKWLGIDEKRVLGDPGLAGAVLSGAVARGFQPALSHRMVLDHGFMTVYDRVSPDATLPVVPIVMNCTTPPLMTLRQSYELGRAVGASVREYDGLERVAICGAGGLSHFVGEPRVGDIDEEFDRWFLRMLEAGCPDELLDMPNDELLVAGNGTGEVRAWVAVAGALSGARTTTLAYEPIYEWINGMGVVIHQP